MNDVMYCYPSFHLYHASAKGLGCAVKMELSPAQDKSEGALWISLANQIAVGGNVGSGRVYPRFDWEKAVVIKLGFNDLCQVLQVFRGITEDIGNGKGLYHTSSRGTTRIVFRHLIEPFAGYSLEVFRSGLGESREKKVCFVFNTSEAEGICEAIAGSMSIITFGIPSVMKSNEKSNRDLNNDNDRD